MQIPRAPSLALSGGDESTVGVFLVYLCGCVVVGC